MDATKAVVWVSLAAVALTGCSGTSLQGTNTLVPGFPKLRFERGRHDFGTLLEGAPGVTARFAFSNEGNSTLTIGRLTTSCGCVTVKEPEKREYLAGERGVLEVELTPTKKHGNVTLSVFVESNDPESPVSTLTVDARIVSFVQFEPPALNLRTVGVGETAVGIVVLQSHQVGLTVAEILPTDDGLEVSPGTSVTVEEGGITYTKTPIEIRLRGQKSTGLLNRRVQVRTTEPKVPVVGFDVTARIVGDIQAVPEQFSLLGPAGEHLVAKPLRLSSRSSTPFRIIEIEPDPHTAARFTVSQGSAAGTASTAFELTLEGAAPAEPGPFEGKVHVRTDRPGEEEIEIPVSGYVR